MYEHTSPDPHLLSGISTLNSCATSAVRKTLREQLKSSRETNSKLRHRRVERLCFTSRPVMHHVYLVAGFDVITVYGVTEQKTQRLELSLIRQAKQFC